MTNELLDDIYKDTFKLMAKTFQDKLEFMSLNDSDMNTRRPFWCTANNFQLSQSTQNLSLIFRNICQYDTKALIHGL